MRCTTLFPGWVLTVVLALLAPMGIHAQARLLLNNGVFRVLNDSARLMLENGATNAITCLGAGGHLVSEHERNVVHWNIGTNTGTEVAATRPFLSFRANKRHGGGQTGNKRRVTGHIDISTKEFADQLSNFCIGVNCFL